MDTLEQIENDFWGTVGEDDTNLIRRIYALRKKNILEFDVEDLRILIGQDVSLKTTVPIAMGILRANLFAEGDHYEGDLLKSILTCDSDFWCQQRDLKFEIISLFEMNRARFKELEITNEIQSSILKAYVEFKGAER